MVLGENCGAFPATTLPSPGFPKVGALPNWRNDLSHGRVKRLNTRGLYPPLPFFASLPASLIVVVLPCCHFSLLSITRHCPFMSEEIMAPIGRHTVALPRTPAFCTFSSSNSTVWKTGNISPRVSPGIHLKGPHITFPGRCAKHFVDNNCSADDSIHFCAVCPTLGSERHWAWGCGQ